MSAAVEVWSCGGGTQSAAIAALIVQGRLPKPEFAIMADTGRERSSTWAYVHSTLRPRLREAGVDLVVVSKAQYATVDLWSENGKLEIPAFTNLNGEIGKLPNYCTNEWKVRVCQRWLNEHVGAAVYNTWLGISRDELKRATPATSAKWQKRFPLLFDVTMRRHQCVDLVVKEMNWPTPPRSSCWMCPNHSDEEWKDIRDNYPEDFAAAVALEREVHERDPHAFLHVSCQPLGAVDFGAPPKASKQLSVIREGCESGHCFT